MRDFASLSTSTVMIFCFAFNFLNLLFFIFLFFKERRVKSGASLNQQEILYYLLFSFSVIIFVSGQLVIELSENFTLSLFFHRLQHAGYALAMIILADFPWLIFQNHRKKGLHLWVIDAVIALTIPLFFTGLLISPTPHTLGAIIQGTETPFYFLVMGIYLAVSLLTFIKAVVYTIEKKMRKQKLTDKEFFITLGMVIIQITSFISLMEVTEVIPQWLGELLGINLGMILFAFLNTVLLTKEFSMAMQTIQRHRQDLEGLRKTVEEEYENLLYTIANIIEKDDQYTAGHSRRVMKLSMEIGKNLGLASPQIEKIKKSGILHDIGKIGVSNILINKPGKLTPEEFEMVKMHSYLGFKIVSNYKPFYEIATFIKEHHEKLNGSGYPNALTREDLPIISKILSVADIYDALKSKRPYRDELTREKSLLIMQDMVEKNEIDLAIFKTLVDVTSYLLLD